MADKDKEPDYYAVLHVDPGADTEEIKRQFRELAKEYHPDRNPGKEELVKPLFQNIQAAYEVLSDPTSRVNYDRKKGYFPFPRPNNPPRNQFTGAYSTAAPRPHDRNPRERSYREPPFQDRRSRHSGYRPGGPQTGYPRQPNQPYPPAGGPAPQYARPGPPPSTPSGGPQYPTAGPPPPSAGAARFASDFNRKPPPPPPQPQARPYNDPGAQDAEQRAQAWRTFYTTMYPESGKRSGFESPESDKKSPIGEKAESRPAFSRTNTASSDRKAGFDPNMRGGQWEPQAQNSSAYNTSYHRAAPPPPANKAGPRPRPQNPKIFTNGSPNRDTASDVRSPEDVPYVEGAPRLPKHYHEVGGEKTYFSSEALKRSNSTRDAPGLNKEALHPKRGTGASHKTQSRARSASPPSRLKPDHASSRPSQTRPATNDGSQTAPRPTAPKKKTTFYAGNSSSSEEVPFTGAANSGLENARHGGRHTTSTGSPASVSQPTEAQASAFWRTRNQDPPPASAKKPNPPSRVSGDMRAEKLNRDLMGEDLTDAKAKAWKAMMDANADLFGDTPNKPRPKPVQTKFASPQWDGQFKGRDRAAPQDTTRSADDRSAAPSPRPQMSRDAALPTDRNPFDPSDIKLGERLRRVVSTASKSNGKPTTSFNFNIPPPPPGPPPKKEKETENGAVKFSAEDWQKTFQEPKWAYPVPAEGRKSPSKGTVRSRRQSIVDAERKKAKKPTTAAVTEETDESEVPQEKTTPRPHDSTPTLPKILTTSDSPDAMDIDSEPATNRSSPRAPRLVPVEPTRIDWRDPFSPTAAKGPLPTAVPNAPQAPTSLPGPPPGPPPKTASQPASAAASRPTSAGADNFNFSGMAAPLNGTSGQSIDNLSDLQTGLPFQSKASDKPPQNSAVPAKKVFELPTEPDPPKPDPSTGVTEALFSRYTSAYALYMAKWQKYEGKILGFLSRRHHDSELRYGEQHLALAATAAVGRSSRGVDVEDHVRELGEEEKVLEVYGAAKKRYRGAMEEFVKAKERVKKSGFAKAH